MNVDQPKKTFVAPELYIISRNSLQSGPQAVTVKEATGYIGTFVVSNYNTKFNVFCKGTHAGGGGTPQHYVPNYSHAGAHS